MSQNQQQTQRYEQLLVGLFPKQHEQQKEHQQVAGVQITKMQLLQDPVQHVALRTLGGGGGMGGGADGGRVFASGLGGGRLGSGLFCGFPAVGGGGSGCGMRV